MHTSRTTTVSAVLIVKDEEAVLEACLESVRWADEVVVYDTGSTDGTLEIARRLATTVVEGYWDDDFGAARNRAAAHATGEWVLVLDADEQLECDPAVVRSQLVRAQGDAFGVLVVDTATQGKRGTDSILSVRVVRRELHRYEGALHEQWVRLDGATMRVPRLDGALVLHSGYREDVVAAKGKGARNLRIARASLDAARRTGVSEAEVAQRTAHVARSLLLDGDPDGALVAGAESLASGALNPLAVVQLARAMVDASTLTENDAERERWYAVWAENAGTTAWVDAARATDRARRGDAAEALDLMSRVPTTSVDPLGMRFDKYAYTVTWAWALATLGRRRDALRVVVESVRRGHVTFSPVGLLDLFDRSQLLTVLAAVRPGEWPAYVHACVRDVLGSDDGAPRARAFLLLMNEARPDDLRTAVACAHVARRLSLEEAAAWAASLRTHGMAEVCPLVAIAADPATDPRQRALAGALAWDVYGDARGRAGLEAALDVLPAEHEAELLAQLDVIAPGLVAAAG